MRSLITHFFQWLAFVIAYVALDWASYLHALYGLNITPWNPSLALGLVCSLRYGRRIAIPWFIALLLGEIMVRGLPAPMLTTIVLSGCMVVGYSAIAETLRRYVNAGDVLPDQRTLLSWLAIVILGTLATSGLYISLLLVADLIPAGDWVVALARFWVGDCVGIIVTMPFFWMLFEHHSRMRDMLLRWETAGYGMLAAFMLWVAFGLGGSGEFQYFYLLFLPLVWAAARQGVAGAAIAAFMLQAGIIIAVHWLQLVAVTAFELQMLGAVLAFVGLFIGVVIDEKQRVSVELRQSLRLAAAGEMAGALAHELNQPLTSLTAYGMACEQLLEQGETGERLRETIHRMISESYRAADVVRRLRDFFRTGATRLETISLGELLASAASPFAAKAQQQGVDLIVDSESTRILLADRLQLEVVLRNLLSNAFDAVADQSAGQRHVRLSAHPESADSVCICVEDSGPGLTEANAGRIFEAFQSSKSSGMGLGLAISRAIVEAHGGSLLAEISDHGLFKLVLPTEGKDDDAA
ncbi:MAG: histidine kinase [Gallionellales bacterium GWA2_59_43]|nr:MAG: histidine kinase [Gallionellales bacterium GWA2_59_43]